MRRFPTACFAAIVLAVAPLAAAQSPSPPPAAAPAADQDQEQAKPPAAAPQPPATAVRREAEQAVDAIRGYSAELREQAMANARRAAEDLDRQMARLQAQTDQRWSRMGEAARTRSQATMADLRQQRNALAEWYGGLRHGSAAAWGEVRVGFVNSYHELAEALRKARAEFGKDETPAAEPPPGDDGR